MTEEKECPKCDVCGEPATNSARDIKQVPITAQSLYIEFKPSGPVKYGCDEHPAKSCLVNYDPFLQDM